MKGVVIIEKLFQIKMKFLKHFRKMSQSELILGETIPSPSPKRKMILCSSKALFLFM